MHERIMEYDIADAACCLVKLLATKAEAEGVGRMTWPRAGQGRAGQGQVESVPGHC